jgi:hypothetical protein
MFHKIKLVKKVFPFEKSPQVTAELVVYGAAIVLSVFATLAFLERLGLVPMLATAVVTIIALFLVSFYVMPHLKGESLPDAEIDLQEGAISNGRLSVSREDVRELWKINYSLGKIGWRVFRIKGKVMISLDTRSYPDADKLDQLAPKLFPGIRMQSAKASSPFNLVIYAAVLYISALVIAGMVI